MIGRNRTEGEWLNNLRQWYGKGSSELFQATAYKVLVAVMMAKVRLADVAPRERR